MKPGKVLIHEDMRNEGFLLPSVGTERRVVVGSVGSTTLLSKFAGEGAEVYCGTAGNERRVDGVCSIGVVVNIKVSICINRPRLLRAFGRR